ncbi:unnamed protein product [Lota lota]
MWRGFRTIMPSQTLGLTGLRSIPPAILSDIKSQPNKLWREKKEGRMEQLEELLGTQLGSEEWKMASLEDDVEDLQWECKENIKQLQEEVS